MELLKRDKRGIFRSFNNKMGQVGWTTTMTLLSIIALAVIAFIIFNGGEIVSNILGKVRDCLRFGC